MSAERFVAEARKMIGVRWRHQSCKAWAVDCLGLVRYCLIHAGWSKPINIPRGYGREPWDDQLRQGLQAHMGAPLLDGWQPGDIPLFRWGKGEPSHVGILANHPHGGLSVIHASNLHNVVETRLVANLLACVEEVYRPDWSNAA